MIWKNSWFQVASIAAILSGCCLIYESLPANIQPSRNISNSANHKIVNTELAGQSLQQNTPTSYSNEASKQLTNTEKQNISSENVSSSLLRKSPQPDQNWTNSLGRKFVPVPGTHVLFDTCDVTVRDYAIFIEKSHYRSPGGVWLMHSNISGDCEFGATNSWKNPGYTQGPEHPVVGVSWDDSEAFCEWLTKRERELGILDVTQYYRLPTDIELSAAVGNTKYSWGSQWPPPKGVGNLAPDLHVDDYENTSPVGSFPANIYGLYDITGNVAIWCEDWYQNDMNTDEIKKIYNIPSDLGVGKTDKFYRGSSFLTGKGIDISKAEPPKFSAYEVRVPTTTKNQINTLGFRCVISFSK
jgi:formylglycine-generating enzyme required for sulfatase activity